MLYSCMAARLGDWAVALTAADEARRLAEEFADTAVGGRGRHGVLTRRSDARRRADGRADGRTG